MRRGYSRELDKATIRKLNQEAVATRREKARHGLERHEDRLIKFFASGRQIDAERLQPRLVEVKAKSEEELLFRYARLQWSIPVSAGYGRRLRFLIFDDQNDKLLGLFGLGDPVFAIKPRDGWIGWDMKAQKDRLRHVLDAFVLGAVPPYNELLCGKLVALLTTSDEVREAFYSKYAGRHGLISEEGFSGELAMVTTTSALGRSSLYNRLTFENERAFTSVGFTSGSGEFHLSNDLYSDILDFANHHCLHTSKHAAWGDGWRNRREVIRSVLGGLGLSRELVYHGVQRQLYVAPLATNTRSFLQGTNDRLLPYDRPAKSIFEWFRKRWLLKRAATTNQYRSFDPTSLRLWRTES
jgi:Domain of unknown function (DUF4338)